MIQIAMSVSEIPIKIVNILECFSARILATISWCRGTRLRTLQKRPLMAQTVAMKIFRIRCVRLSMGGNGYNISEHLA
jgi:hypothetical protein